MRRTIETLAVLLVLGLMVRTWSVQGLLVPFQVTSGSMAETLLGPHREIVCAACGHRFVCGTDRRPASARVVCPNCGYWEDNPQEWPEIPGDRLLVDKAAFHLRSPRRWEVVAFRDPQRASRVVAKRVVGLPGESVEIRHGDVYVDGRIARKTLAQQRALAVLVHDAQCLSQSPAISSRWQHDAHKSHWSAVDGGFSHPEVSGEAAIDWLTYAHRRPSLAIPGSTEEAPISNWCGYNQLGPQRGESLDPAGDLLLSFRIVRLSGPGHLVIRATDGTEDFRVRIDSQRARCRVDSSGRREVLEPEGSIPADLDGVRVELSLFDRQLLVAFDGRVAVQLPYERGDAVPQATPRPLAIGSQGLGIDIREVRVYRDVYYTEPLGLRGRQGGDNLVRLGEDEYYVLGDNSPISEDSRTWANGAALSANLLVGKPLLVHYPTRVVRLGPWRFQVPDPRRIRYIR